ncbi:MAG: exodeoxyribonuclease VII small subunit [Phycisphaerales bacterium]|nr:exodeoxyribonuclease VII small subunit [Phycisphaerales bacterium]
MTKPKPTRAKATPTEPSFEQALAEVEAIIEQIESGEMGLEEQIEQYAKGAQLLDRCRTVLNRCEQRVEEISAQLDRRDQPQGDESEA